jgi:hypothetical protein
MPKREPVSSPVATYRWGGAEKNFEKCWRGYLCSFVTGITVLLVNRNTIPARGYAEMKTVTFAFCTAQERIVAAQFMAELVRQNVTFKAATTGDGLEMVISFTGGY